MERSFVFYTTEGHGWLSSLTGNLAPLVLGLEQSGYILLKVTPYVPVKKFLLFVSTLAYLHG